MGRFIWIAPRRISISLADARFDHYPARCGTADEIMADEFSFKDVWFKNDAKAEQDAIAAWTAAKVLPKGVDPIQRAKELLVIAYDGDKVVAISTCEIAYLTEVRQKMAMFRIFVAPDYRKSGVAIPLTHAAFAATERYALANPQQRIGGLGAYVIVSGHMGKPILGAGMWLIGYSKENYPIVVKWFPHFTIDEAEAAARVPKQS
jgi:hypothetical protein